MFEVTLEQFRSFEPERIEFTLQQSRNRAAHARTSIDRIKDTSYLVLGFVVVVSTGLMFFLAGHEQLPASVSIALGFLVLLLSGTALYLQVNLSTVGVVPCGNEPKHLLNEKTLQLGYAATVYYALEHMEMGIEQNRATNTRLAKRFDKALRIILFSPFIALGVYGVAEYCWR